MLDENLIKVAPVKLDKYTEKIQMKLQKVFDDCDIDTACLLDDLKFKMEYPNLTSYSRSRYSVAFVCKYMDAYVVRVFAKNDIYSQRVRAGLHILESFSSEIFRIIYLDGKVYSFSKNLTYSEGNYNVTNTTFTAWHESKMSDSFTPNKIIRVCDLGYLNDCVENNSHALEYYSYSLFAAINDDKFSIAFENGYRFNAKEVKKVCKFLQEFTYDQIEFACQNVILFALPFIKNYNIKDIDILKKIDFNLRNPYYNDGSPAYTYHLFYKKFKQSTAKFNIDANTFDSKVINLIIDVQYFSVKLYVRYICYLDSIDATLDDYFAVDYYSRMLDHGELFLISLLDSISVKFCNQVNNCYKIAKHFKIANCHL